MNVLGVDVSTRAVHTARLPFDSDEATVQVYDATDCKGDALVRARTLADLLPRRRSKLWDDVALVAIERPFGVGTRAVGDMMLVVGLVIACLPPELEVWLLGPTEWRKACGMPGNASKEDVRWFAMSHWPEGKSHSPPASWAQDLCDAYCVAWAARALNAKGVEAAA